MLCVKLDEVLAVWQYHLVAANSTLHWTTDRCLQVCSLRDKSLQRIFQKWIMRQDIPGTQPTSSFCFRENRYLRNMYYWWEFLTARTVVQESMDCFYNMAFLVSIFSVIMNRLSGFRTLSCDITDYVAFKLWPFSSFVQTIIWRRSNVDQSAPSTMTEQYRHGWSFALSLIFLV